MKSRMEKYYNNDTSNERSSRNKELYSEVYEKDFYTELATLGNSNEIDISKVRELVQSREEYQKAKEYRSTFGTNIKPIQRELPTYEEFNYNYDINDVMKEAKAKREVDSSYRKLSNEEYDILSKIDINELEKQANELLNKNKKEEEELKELINTISSQTLAKQTKEALALDLLNDLKETTVINTEVREEEKEEYDNEDSSFFTTSAAFDKNDFEELEDEMHKKESSPLITVLIIIIVVVIIILALFLVQSLI